MFHPVSRIQTSGGAASLRTIVEPIACTEACLLEAFSCPISPLRPSLCSAIIPSSSLWTITLAARIIVRDDNLVAEGHLGNDTMHAPAPPCVATRWHAADTPG